jgi:hypothetical protein
MKKVFSMGMALLAGLLASCLVAEQPGVPAEIEALSVEPGDHAVTLTWNRSAGALSYTAFLIRENGELRDGGLNCTVSDPDTTCVLSGIPHGVAVSFAVYAQGSPDGEYSEICAPARTHDFRPVIMTTCLTVSAEIVLTAAPRRPEQVTAGLVLGEVVVFWDAVAGGDTIAATYEVRAVEDSTKRCGDTTTLAGTDQRRSCLVDGLVDGVPYTFRVFGRNGLVQGPLSAASAPVIRLGPPGAPDSVLAEVGNGQVTVSWAPPALDGGLPITRYKAYATADTLKSCATTGTRTCVIPGLTNGVAYTFAVKATNGRGAGPASAASPPVTPNAAVIDVPGAPTGVTAVPGHAEVLVSWTAPAANGGSVITGYKAYAVSDTAKSCEATGPACTIYGLTNGAAYTFVARAINAAGSGPLSLPSAPATPTSPPAWTVRTSGTANTLKAVATSGSVFVAVGDSGTVLTSPNGTTWTLRNSGSDAALGGVANGGGVWAVVGADGTILTSSDNGMNWTPRKSGTTNPLAAVVRADSQWVAVGAAGTILTSPDAATWTVRTSGTANALNGVAWSPPSSSGKGQWVAVGAAGTIVTSADGITWTSRLSPTPNAYNAVAWAGTAFVAVGANFSPHEYASADGITWTARTTGAGATTALYGVAWMGNQLLIVGSGGTVLGSSTASRGSAPLTVLNGNQYGAAGNSSLWVVVGANGSLATSSP